MKKYVRMLRVKHWLKNVLIFAPLFFGEVLFDYAMIAKSFYAFLVFGLAASVVYIINDINDVEKDRKHPTKCKRPTRGRGRIQISCPRCGTQFIKKS